MTEGNLEGAAWFAQVEQDIGIQMLQPLDETVNYAVLVQPADPWTVELVLEKYWHQPNGGLGLETVTLNTYEPAPENENEVAMMEREQLLNIYHKEGLDALIRAAWQMGVDTEHLHQDDLKLFQQGPKDRFSLEAREKESPALGSDL